ncbi:MAG: hypothetical protein RR458_07175 [Clostridia bacterium]
MEEILNIAVVPTIVGVVYFLITVYKTNIAKGRETFLTWIPVIAGGLGIVIGVLAFFFAPTIIPADNIIVAILIGGASGLAATGTNQILKQYNKNIETKTNEK